MKIIEKQNNNKVSVRTCPHTFFVAAFCSTVLLSGFFAVLAPTPMFWLFNKRACGAIKT